MTYEKFPLWATILLILSSIPRFQASKNDIFNLNDDQLAIDTRTRAMIELTRKCLSTNHLPLGVSEKLNDKLIKYFHQWESTSLISLASSKLFILEWYSASLKSKEWYCGQKNYRFLWKSSGFLISASSPANLKEQIDNLKNTRWWNSAGFFILTDYDNSIIQSCSNAYEFLSLAWKYNLLNSVFICQELDGNSSIYSYNPYGNSAPQPWLKNRETKGPQGHTWNLFKIEQYHGYRYTCENIFFDKTTSLNGYPISTNALSITPFLYFDYTETDLEKYNGEDGWMMKNIWKFLNASIVNVKLDEKDAKLGWVDDNGTLHGNFIDIRSGKVEIGLNSVILQPVWELSTTYPHTSVNLCLMTKNRGTVPWLIGLIMICDRWTIVCAVVTFFIGTLIFGYVNKHRYFLEFLNILRVVISTSFIHPPSLTGLRMILCFIFLMPIVSYSTFQGKILSLIQNPIEYANIENFQDLISAGYHLEGPETLKSFIPTGELLENFVPDHDLNSCIKKIHNHEPVACCNYCFSLMVKASYDKSLYISKNTSDHYQNQYITGPDWPLLDRFDVIARRMVESGLTRYYRLESLYEKVSFSEDDSGAVVIHLRDFRYVFIGLGIGWVCGILAFIGEVLVAGRSRKREIPKNRAMPMIQGLKMWRLMNRMKII